MTAPYFGEKNFSEKSYEKICFCAQNFLSLLPISLENGLMSCRGGFMKPSTAINTFISIIHLGSYFLIAMNSKSFLFKVYDAFRISPFLRLVASFIMALICALFITYFFTS